jgi:uncharacterized protein YcgI (DUF1989 family)
MTCIVQAYLPWIRHAAPLCAFESASAPPAGILCRMALTVLPAGTGVGLTLTRGQRLRIVDPGGGQSGDLTAFKLGDITEWLSNGRSFDYGGKIQFSTGDVLYSNRSNPVFTIVHDDVGRHDFLYTPCSPEMYRIQYGIEGTHPNCLENMSRALAQHGVAPHLVPTAFNFFMNSEVRPDGTLHVGPPLSRANDALEVRAEMDLVVAVTSCPALLCNGGAAGPLAYEVLAA